jgi:hypothetical protein
MSGAAGSAPTPPWNLLSGPAAPDRFHRPARGKNWRDGRSGVDVIDTFGFNAPAEVVYNNLIDPDRTDRWLPGGMTVAGRSDGSVRLASGTDTVDVEVSTTGADMRVTFQVVRPLRLHGSAQVKQAPAGGSQIYVAITTDQPGPDRETVRRLLDEAMRLLERDVDDNFTAG